MSDQPYYAVKPKNRPWQVCGLGECIELAEADQAQWLALKMNDAYQAGWEGCRAALSEIGKTQVGGGFIAKAIKTLRKGKR